jgi:peptidoglycan hydrolase-like protein with peptidoglycan-binding domain
MAFAIPRGFLAALAAAAILSSPGTTLAAASCPTDLSEQTYKAYVAGTQEELNVHGYDAGAPDGVLAAKTEAAIRQYQRDAGLPVDGCVTKALLDHMKFVLPKVERPRRANAKPIVVEIQTLLTRRGYYLGPVDGVAGLRTQAAIARFAEDASITTSGAIDQALAEQIRSADPGIRGDRGAAR